MGKLAIRRVIYNGDKYYFESPYLKNGIVILDGDNEHGKSTFMDLIYFGLGGKVYGFTKNDSRVTDKHNEIYHDTNNYVELEVEINGEVFELTRHFIENKIYIVDASKNVLETSVYRNSGTDSVVFSDWILNKLGIDVFDIVQGTKSFKLGFTDLMRLIYHDQKTEVDKIYKSPENDNFISDSLEIRKAVFEVLVGEVYNEYYSLLGKYKMKSKELDDHNALLVSYNNFLKEINKDKLENMEYIQEVITKKEVMLKKLELERNSARVEKIDTSDILMEIEVQKKESQSLHIQKEIKVQAKKAVEESMNKIVYLLDETEREIREIEKIRFVNKKLNLFSPNTCPYCLVEVEREKGKCICGNSIDEEHYEKFFYSNEEYLEILKVRKKSKQSLTTLLDKKLCRLNNINNEIEVIDKSIKDVNLYISDLGKDISSDYNSAYVRRIDDRINEIKEEIINLEHTKELAAKKEELIKKLSTLRSELDILKLRVDEKQNKAQLDMLSKKKVFNEIYEDLMKGSDKYCYDAYIGEDYMPYTNNGMYRARSALVPKRFMYFLTLLILGLQYNLNYPRFLMIDTPNKEGIDPKNLITILKQLSKVYKLRRSEETQFQVILTTGTNVFPRGFKKYVFLTLKDGEKLLNEKIKAK